MRWTKEQEQVISLRGRNILVSAAAGSGKTATLVERIIERVTGTGSGENAPIDIDRLLIVTFTRAAAAEMRERIGAAIEERRVKHPENMHLQRQALLLHSAQITTIDSFCLMVIRDYFHEIDLDPVFRVADEEELTLLRHEVISDVLEEAYEAGEQDFLSFAQNYGGRHQDLKLEDYILRLFQFSESCPWPKEWLLELGGSVKEITKLESTSLSDFKLHTEESQKEAILLKDACVGISESVNEPKEDAFSGEWMEKVVWSIKRRLKDALCLTIRAISICNDPDGPISYLSALEDDREFLENLICCKSYRALSIAFDEIKFTALSRKAMPDCADEKKSQVKALRDQVKDCIKGLRTDFFFQDYEQMGQDEQNAARYVRVLVNLTLSFREKFAQKKAEKHLLDFSDIEHFALNILTEKKDGVLIARGAALELRRRFEEIMIDEYQDSNEVQETILRSISREEEGRPNIFMVGDMKQSIYRFRLAKPELFLQKYNTYSLEESKYQRIDLHKNFRSREEVLASINELFFRLMGREFGQIEYDEAAALYPGAQYLSGEEKDDYLTELLLVPGDAKEEEIEEDAEDTESLSEDEENEEREYSKQEKEALACVQKIKEYRKKLMVQGKDEANNPVLRPCRYGDIVILLRTVSGFAEVFTKVLTEQGIPAISDTQSGYFNVPEIKWLLNYLRILDNPRQDIPYVNVLLSPFVGLSTDELAALRSKEKRVPLVEIVRNCAAPYMQDENYQKDDLTGKEDDAPYMQDENYQKDGLTGKEDAAPYMQDKQKDKEEELESQGNLRKPVGKRLADFLFVYDELRERSRILSVPELLEELFARTGYDSFITAMPAGGRRSRNLAAFMEKAAAFGESSYRGLFQFIRYVERLIKYEVDYGEAAETSEGEDAVRIMSIHRSKGLEFPVVLVCGLTKKFNFSDTRERILFHPDEGIAMDYIDEVKRTVVPTLRKKVLKQQMEEEMLGEELRLLYVAMTRAKEKLCMIGYVENYEKLSAKWEAVAPVGKEKLFYLTLAKAKTYLDFIGPVIKILTHTNLQFAPFSGEAQIKSGEGREQELLRQQFLNGLGGLAPNPVLLSKIRDFLNFDYPYAMDAELPFKVSVSELNRESLGEEFETPKLYEAQEAIQVEEDEMEEISKEAEATKLENADFFSYEGTLPEFLKEKQELKGTDRGTLYHRVLELLPLTRKPQRDTIKAGLEELVCRGRLKPEERREISVAKLFTFYQSPIAQRMCAAGERGGLYKEQPFVFALPAREVLKKESDEPILIQGIIDVFFEEEDGVVVLDYKTDYVPENPEETLRSRYGEQLALYKRAVEEITGKHVKEKILYSFYLGREIVV